MPALHCGIDIGTTNVKVVLLDDEGRTVFSLVQATPRIADGTAIATDARALVAFLEDMIIAGWRKAGSGVALRTISSAGVGEDGIGVTRDLVPTGLAIPWHDKRAAGEAEWLRQSDAVTPCSGIAIGPDVTLSKWLWLHRNRPDELSQAQWWIALTDYLLVWWSGRPFMSASLAPRTGCYNVFSRQWIDTLLAVSHAPKLPDLLHAGEAVGGVRNGPLRESGAASPETLVIAGGHDHPMAASMLKRFHPDGRVDSLGTANLVYGETIRKLDPQLNPLLAFSLPPRATSGISCLGVMEFSAFLQSKHIDEALFRSLLQSGRFPGSPSLSASESGDQDMIGPAIVRRALEDASFHARDMFDAMNDLGVPLAPLYMTGGWSRSHAFAELRASVFGEAVNVVGDVELSATGAAVLAAETVTGRTVPVTDQLSVMTIEPVAEWRERYEELHASRREAPHTST